MVPLDDPESNYRLLSETLLEPTGALGHAVPTEGSAEEAASAYAREIRQRVPARADGVPTLDMALLGLGEDGHTASLFPDAPTLDVRGEVCVAVHDAPKPPPDRVSLTLDVLRAARASLILAVGDGKAGAVAGVLSGPNPGVPASLLADGPLELIVDRTAAQEIPDRTRAS
jgi:6-phosphogluconolactonase